MKYIRLEIKDIISKYHSFLVKTHMSSILPKCSYRQGIDEQHVPDSKRDAKLSVSRIAEAFSFSFQ